MNPARCAMDGFPGGAPYLDLGSMAFTVEQVSVLTHSRASATCAGVTPVGTSAKKSFVHHTVGSVA
jgi:hypothetical protein